MAAPIHVLHRRLAAVMGLAALAAFVSGAGLDTWSPVLAAAALLLALVWVPGPRLQRALDPVWRIAAILLAVRAVYRVVVSPDDVVLPMVDLLLVLMVSEGLREGGAGESRVYSLSFALLIAACAYRPGVIFAASFITYTAVAVVALMLGHLIRKLAEHKAREVRLERSFLWRIASLSIVLLALSAVVFTAFPRVSRGWAVRGPTQGSSAVGFSDRVSLAEHGGRIYPNPDVVLRVEFPEGAPGNPRSLYWRGRSYDYFDGVAWARSAAIPMSSPPTAFYAARWPGARVLQRVYAVPLDVPVLFALHPVLNVQPQGRIRAMQDNVGDIIYFGPGTPTYDAVSAAVRPPDDALRNAREATGFAGERFYLQQPPLSDRVGQLADSLTANAPTRFDKVVAVQEWLRNEFRYTLDLPQTAREATLEHFLFRRRAGHCEYFSTAMAVLLREVGIPARNVNGFLGGSWNEFGSYVTVTQNEAHSWVEVWFPGYGWVPFDGTPAATTDVAAQREDWLGPLRGVLDGFEHRWNKWILEYNLEKQVGLFQRATEQFARRDNTGELKLNPGISRGLKIAMGAAFVLFLMVALFRRARFEDLRAESRAYVKLRRAYERAGYDVRGNDAPMRFVHRLRAADAPGHEAARRAVDLYLRSRFGGEDIGADGARNLREASAEALRALRARRGVGGPTRKSA